MEKLPINISIYEIDIPNKFELTSILWRLVKSITAEKSGELLSKAFR
jgi:hypothetical protein